MALVMPSSSAAVAERTTFVGAVVKDEVKRLPKHLGRLQEETHALLLNGVCACVRVHVCVCVCVCGWDRVLVDLEERGFALFFESSFGFLSPPVRVSIVTSGSRMCVFVCVCVCMCVCVCVVYVCVCMCVCDGYGV